jgi:putative peptidoglycan lipid II flippase
LSSVALLPVTGALIVLGPALTSVILLGRFSTEQARLTGFALAAGAFGLLPFALVMLQQRVFYAMRDAKTPTFINISMVTVKVGLVIAASQLLHGDAVIIALTVATSASYVAGAVSGHLFLRRRFGNVGFRSVLRTVGWVAIAAFAATLMALFVVVMVGSLIGISRGAGLIELVAGAGLGGAVLITVAHRLPLPEVAEILAAIGGRRFSRPE